MTLEELQQIIYDAGIVGAGGAGFPTHKKLAPGIKQIVINAAECEPLMMVDHHIFKNHLLGLITSHLKTAKHLYFQRYRARNQITFY